MCIHACMYIVGRRECLTAHMSLLHDICASIVILVEFYGNSEASYFQMPKSIDIIMADIRLWNVLLKLE